MGFLDIRTIVFNGTVTSFICALVLLLLWQQNRRRFAGTGFWFADLALQTATFALLGLRGLIPDWISFALANTMALVGALLGYIGLEQFTGKKGPQLQNYLLLAVFLCVHTYFYYVRPDLAARSLIFSLAMLILCFQCFWLLLFRVDPGARSWTLGVGIVFGGYCLVNLVRIVHYFSAAPSVNDYFRLPYFDTLILIAYHALLVLLTYSLALMVNKRLLLGIRTQEEKFSKAFHSSPYAITLSRLSDGIVLEVNDGFVTLSGHPAAEVLGKKSSDLHLWVRPEDRDLLIGELSRSGKVQGKEVQIRRKSGEIMTGIFSAEIIRIEGEECVLSSTADISKRKEVEREREQLIVELQDALSRIKTLSGLLPICASCKKIRNDEGYWEQIEGYIRDRSDAEFSHSICPDCVKRLYPDLYEKLK